LAGLIRLMTRPDPPQAVRQDQGDPPVDDVLEESEGQHRHGRATLQHGDLQDAQAGDRHAVLEQSLQPAQQAESRRRGDRQSQGDSAQQQTPQGIDQQGGQRRQQAV